MLCFPFPAAPLPSAAACCPARRHPFPSSLLRAPLPAFSHRRCCVLQFQQVPRLSTSIHVLPLSGICKVHGVNPYFGNCETNNCSKKSKSSQKAHGNTWFEFTQSLFIVHTSNKMSMVL